MVDLVEYLPPSLLRDGHPPAFTRISIGMSNAAVHRVDVGGAALLLRIAGDGAAAAAAAAEEEEEASGGAEAARDEWSRQLTIERAAASAGIAPRILHVDEQRRAVVSEFVVDRGLAPLLFAPPTRDRALDLLASAFARLHALPPPPDTIARDPHAQLERVFAALTPGALPAFIVDAVMRERDAPQVPSAPRVLAHNDPNPANILFDGERVLFVDWDVAGTMHPLYDLAVAAMFLHFDDEMSRALLAAYRKAGAATGDDDADLALLRRLRAMCAVLCGVTLASLAIRDGYTFDARVDAATVLSLGDVFGRVRAGAVDLTKADGKAAFALALIKESAR